MSSLNDFFAKKDKKKKGKKVKTLSVSLGAKPESEETPEAPPAVEESTPAEAAAPAWGNDEAAQAEPAATSASTFWEDDSAAKTEVVTGGRSVVDIKATDEVEEVQEEEVISTEPKANVWGGAAEEEEQAAEEEQPAEPEAPAEPQVYSVRRGRTAANTGAAPDTESAMSFPSLDDAKDMKPREPEPAAPVDTHPFARQGHGRPSQFSERARYSDQFESERQERDRFGGDRFGGDRDRFGGDRFGGDRDRFGGDRFGGDRDRFGGDRFGGDRERFGGDRERFGGDRERFGGDRERFGGDRERFGGDRERFGGDRERFGGDRERFGGDRERFGGDRERFGGDRDRFGDRGGDRYNRREESPADMGFSRDQFGTSSAPERQERPRMNLQPRSRPVEGDRPAPAENTPSDWRSAPRNVAEAPAQPQRRTLNLAPRTKPVELEKSKQMEIEERAMKRMQDANKRPERRERKEPEKKEAEQPQKDEGISDWRSAPRAEVQQRPSRPARKEAAPAATAESSSPKAEEKAKPNRGGRRGGAHGATVEWVSDDEGDNEGEVQQTANAVSAVEVAES